jgi:hypothetical protein
MTASEGSVKLLVTPVIRWMQEGGDPWAVNLAYWNTRRELMGTGETFDGPGDAARNCELVSCGVALPFAVRSEVHDARALQRLAAGVPR